MPKIEWKGIIENPADYQMGFLSKNAKKLNMPKTLNEMMIKALPFVIPSIIPITLFCISPPTATGMNGFLFGLSIMGLTSPYVDSYNVYQVLRQTSKSDSIQFYGDDLYVISEKA